MNNPDSTQAEPTPAASPAVKTAGPAVDFRRSICIDVPQFGYRFSFAVTIHPEHPDMPAMSISSGAASFQVYPTPDQARQMAMLLIDLAERFEASHPAVIQ